jgi:poly-gamma-glutamate capsule biosynthesis protein CapA/YwtB (metallophosphatase superfamily)
VFAGGAEFIATPTPPTTAPTLPDWTAGKKIVRVTASLDSIDLNASANTIYVLPTGYAALASKPRTINKAGIHLVGEGLTPTASDRLRAALEAAAVDVHRYRQRAGCTT